MVVCVRVLVGRTCSRRMALRLALARRGRACGIVAHISLCARGCETWGMDLFKLFRRGDRQGEAPAVEADAAPFVDDSWGGRLGRLDEMDAGAAAALVQAFLAEVGAAYEGAKVLPPNADGDVELRARSAGLAFRFVIDAGTWWLMPDMKFDNRTGELELTRDLQQVPSPRDSEDRDEDDPWGEDDALRVFVAKGIFVEGVETDVDETLAVLDSLPAAHRTELLAGMERLGISWLQAGSDQLSVRFDPNLDRLGEPVETVHACVSLMARLAVQLGEGSRDMGAEAKVLIRGAVEIDGQLVQPSAAQLPQRRFERAACAYCRTIFRADGDAPKCPNCGAPLGR